MAHDDHDKATEIFKRLEIIRTYVRRITSGTKNNFSSTVLRRFNYILECFHSNLHKNPQFGHFSSEFFSNESKIRR